MLKFCFECGERHKPGEEKEWCHRYMGYTEEDLKEIFNHLDKEIAKIKYEKESDWNNFCVSYSNYKMEVIKW